jgi:hypothetical protein
VLPHVAEAAAQPRTEQAPPHEERSEELDWSKPHQDPPAAAAGAPAPPNGEAPAAAAGAAAPPGEAASDDDLAATRASRPEVVAAQDAALAATKPPPGAKALDADLLPTRQSSDAKPARLRGDALPLPLPQKSLSSPKLTPARSAVQPPAKAAQPEPAPGTATAPTKGGSSTPPPGKVFGDRYVLGSPLGRGRMGLVWIAEDQRLQREVALKILGSLWAASDDARRRFEREARAVAKLHSPHIVQVFDCGIDASRPYIANECTSGNCIDGYCCNSPCARAATRATCPAVSARAPWCLLARPATRAARPRSLPAGAPRHAGLGRLRRVSVVKRMPSARRLVL